jgi:hypothetical protein
MRRRSLLLGAAAGGLLMPSIARPGLVLAPTGAPAGGGGTTWNPADKSSNITLSVGNLTATNTAAAEGDAFVRSVASHATGKYYWELIYNGPYIGGSTGIGIAVAAATVADATSTNNIAAWYLQTGNAWVNGSNAGSGGAIVLAGDVMSLAINLDAGARTIWFRKNGGLWNGSATDNPATGAGGFSFSVLSPPYFAWVTPTWPAGLFTANFGGSAFSFTPPSGFGAF